MKKLTVAVRNFANALKNVKRGAEVSSSNESLCKVPLREIGIQFYELYILKGS